MRVAINGCYVRTPRSQSIIYTANISAKWPAVIDILRFMQ